MYDVMSCRCDVMCDVMSCHVGVMSCRCDVMCDVMSCWCDVMLV